MKAFTPFILIGSVLGSSLPATARAESLATHDPGLNPQFAIVPGTFSKSIEDMGSSGMTHAEEGLHPALRDALPEGDLDLDPPPPHVYLVGRKNRDLAAYSRIIQPDQQRDTWLRLYIRNLGFSIHQIYGTAQWSMIKGMILRTRDEKAYRQWDTLAGSHFPLLQVEARGRLLNGFDGSIAGFKPLPDDVIDLFIGDDGLIAGRKQPLELVILTMAGDLKLDVKRDNIHNQWSD